MSTVALDPQEMPTQRLLSGLYVPENLGEVTAPIDVVDRPAEPEPKPERPAPAEVFRPENPTPSPAPGTTPTTTPPEKKPAPPPAQPTSPTTQTASDTAADKR